MTVIRGGVGDIWHIYQKDTGKGKNIIVRNAHSVQSSTTLKTWQSTVKKAAITGLVTKAARDACVDYANSLESDEAKRRFFSDLGTKRCRMAALRPFMALALEWVAKHRSEIATKSEDEVKKMKDDVVKYIKDIYSGKSATGATAGGGKAGEVRGLWL